MSCVIALQYLSDVEAAKRITRETVKVFHAHGVTTLVESNVSKANDLLLLNELISKQHLELEESQIGEDGEMVKDSQGSIALEAKLEKSLSESPSIINMKKRRLEAPTSS